MAGFDAGQLLGPLGGQLAIAFGAGCASGYAFCLRTVYKLLSVHTDARHNDCMQRIVKLEEEREDLKQRITILEDRLYSGHARQMEQMRESTVRIIGEDKFKQYGLNQDKKDE